MLMTQGQDYYDGDLGLQNTNRYTIQHIPGTKNQVADCLSRIHLMQTRIKKENKSPEIKPFPEKPFSKAKNIAILISPDKIREEPILQNLKIAKSQKGEIQLVKTKKRNIFLIFTRTKIGIYDSFNNTDQ